MLTTPQTQDLRLAVDNSKKSSLPKHHQEAAEYVHVWDFHIRLAIRD